MILNQVYRNNTWTDINPDDWSDYRAGDFLREKNSPICKRFIYYVTSFENNVVDFKLVRVEQLEEK